MLQPKHISVLPWTERINASERLSAFMKQPGIADVLEWTFLYDGQSKKDGTPYNTTFFQDIGRVSYEEWKQGFTNWKELIEKVSLAFSGHIENLTNIRNQLEEDSHETKRRIEQESIDSMITNLRTAQASVAIEMEKAYPGKLLNDTERRACVQKVEEGQTDLYGGKISENPEEVAATLELICTEYADKKKFLSEAEQKRYVELYTRLTQELRKKDYINDGFSDIEWYRSAPKPEQHAFTKAVLDRCEKTDIPKARYMQMWQFCIDVMGFRQKVRENKNVSSIYDGSEYLEVPIKPSHETKSLKAVLRLMAHEVCVHYVNQDISERNGFRIRGAGNVEKDEGLAILVEWLLQWFKLWDLKKAGHSYPYILAGETLSQEERQEFIELRMKMGSKWKSGDTDFGRDLRTMRGYPLEEPWAQRKDCSYGRWTNRIIEIIETSNLSVMDFYRGKFSIDDIVSWRLRPLLSDEKRVFPLVIPEMILYTIGTGEQNFQYADFIQYLKEKYAWDIPEQYLNNAATVNMISCLKMQGILNLVPSVAQ